MSINRQMKKTNCYNQIMEYYSAMKRNGLPTCATIWVNLKSFTLNKRSTYNRIPFLKLWDSMHKLW